MADRVVVFEGKRQVFPDDATDAEISAALGAIPQANASAAPKAKTWTDTAVDALPAIGGTVGAIIGGTGGTAFGLGFGGVPGAAGGAGLGSSAGKAAQQLINRLRGAEAPQSSGEAAADIGLSGAEAAATTAALGGAGKVLSTARGPIAKGLQSAGKVVAQPHSVKRMVGQGMQAAGRALEQQPVAPKVAISATDFTRIKALIDQGIPEMEAVRTILNLKAKGL